MTSNSNPRSRLVGTFDRQFSNELAATEDSECTNPVCTHVVTDEQRAGFLRQYCNRLKKEGWSDLRLMPLNENDRGPAIIQKGYKLTSQEARALLVTPGEAARRIEEGVRGFYIYADMADHGTEGLIFTDEDEPAQWPDPRFAAGCLRLR